MNSLFDYAIRVNSLSEEERNAFYDRIKAFALPVDSFKQKLVDLIKKPDLNKKVREFFSEFGETVGEPFKTMVDNVLNTLGDSDKSTRYFLFSAIFTLDRLIQLDVIESSTDINVTRLLSEMIQDYIKPLTAFAEILPSSEVSFLDESNFDKTNFDKLVWKEELGTEYRFLEVKRFTKSLFLL